MACGCSSGGGGCSKKANPLGNQARLERYKLKEIIRKLKPIAEQMARVTNREVEEVYRQDLKLPLRSALIFEVQEMDEKISQEEIGQAFDEDFDYALDVFLGKVTLSTSEKPPLDCKILFRICTGPSCERKGSDALLQALQDQFNLAPGKVTDDGQFGLETSSCFRQCRQGPNLQRNEEMHQEVTLDQLENIIDRPGLEKAAQYREKMEMKEALVEEE